MNIENIELGIQTNHSEFGRRTIPGIDYMREGSGKILGFILSEIEFAVNCRKKKTVPGVAI